eukprot:2174707-Prymnesium_polylepis.1
MVPVHHRVRTLYTVLSTAAAFVSLDVLTRCRHVGRVPTRQLARPRAGWSPAPQLSSPLSARDVAR